MTGELAIPTDAPPDDGIAEVPDTESSGGVARVLFPVLLIALVAALLANAGTGAVRIGPVQVLAIIAQHLGIHTRIAFTEQQDAVLWAIRLPRVVLTLLIGSGLGMAGAALQGIFRNPLADPGLIGVSSGAALGAVTAIVGGFTLFGAATLPLAAFCGGLLATSAVYAMSRHNGRVEVVTLILSGIAVNAVVGAGIGLATFFANDRQLRSLVFWTLGSASGATWRTTLVAGACIGVGLVLLPRWSGVLNLFALGDREARHLGVNTERSRGAVIVLAALVTGAAVSVAGIVGFIGLVSPHVVRLVSGPDHRVVLPASALTGATLLLVADLIARTLVIPRELPLGVVTALVGGPFFLWLVLRTRTAQGGWG